MTYKTLYITQNSPFLRDIQVLSGGEPVDIDGYTVTMYISKYFGSETKYQVPAAVYNGNNGIVRASISAAATQQIPYGTMQYSVFLEPPDSDNFLIVQGQVVIIPTVF